MIRPTTGVPLVIGSIWLGLACATCVAVRSSADAPAEAFDPGPAALVVLLAAFSFCIVLCAFLLGAVRAFEAWHAKRDPD